jgi:Big-like domain-containing protein
MVRLRDSHESAAGNATPDGENAMHAVRLAAVLTAMAVALSVGEAEACAYSVGAAWTRDGGGMPAQLMVLGGETCEGNIRWGGLQVIAPPQHGKVRVIGPSTYVYTPKRAYRGPDEFKVSASDATAGLIIGTVAIMVQ